jgi:hypothetical protein
MIKAQIHLVDGKRLLEFPSVNCAISVLLVTVIHFDASELRLFDTSVQTNHIQSNNVWLMSFQWTGNRKIVRRVSVQNVNELLFLYSSDHDTPTFGVCS